MKNTLGLVFFPAFDWMISPTHPERQERLLYTRDQLEEEGLFDCEEIKEYPDRIIGIVSEIPEYETWGSGNVEVNNRIWIKVK